MRKHGLLWLVGMAGLVACGGGTGTTSTSSPQPTVSPATSACTPSPCATAVAGDMTVYVTRVDKNFPLPRVPLQKAGDHYSRLTLKFEYHGATTVTVSAPDLTVTGPDGIQGTIRDLGDAVAPGCSVETPELEVDSVYIITPCFEVGGDPAGPLILRYQPSFFSKGVSVNLP